MTHEIQHLVEAAIYADDLDRAEAFYRDVLGMKQIGKQSGRHVFFRAGRSVLLIFRPEETLRGGDLPAHGARGPGHVALGIAADSFDSWRQRLQSNGVPIERLVDWPRGARSLYFRDPAGNSVELITPGAWDLEM